MTDAEILERLRAYFQTKVENLSGDEMAEGPFEDGTEYGDLWEQAASRIDARGGLRVRFEFGDTDPAVQLREERAVAEARPHDDEPQPGDVIKCQQCGQQTRSISRGCSVCGLGMAHLDEPGKDAGHVWMPYPDEPGRRCTCSIGHDHDENPDDGPSQAQETRAAADRLAEPGDDRYDELGTPAFEDRGGQVYLNGTDAW